jgi:hypothetical protein
VVSFELTSRFPLSNHSGHLYGRPTALQVDPLLHFYNRSLDERTGAYHTVHPSHEVAEGVEYTTGGVNLRAMQAFSNAQIDDSTRRHLQKHAAWRASLLAQEV